MANKKQEKQVLIHQPTLPLFSVPWLGDNNQLLGNNAHPILRVLLYCCSTILDWKHFFLFFVLFRLK
jgi:hypothetical protein